MKVDLSKAKAGDKGEITKEWRMVKVNKVDLSKAKAGDTVEFRCGGETVIHGIDFYTKVKDDRITYKVDFCDREFMYFFKDGNISNNIHPFDIVDIIPAPFDWADVKQGMAFEDNNYQVFYFVAEHPICRSYIVATKSEKSLASECLKTLGKKSLTRTSEHDLEVE